MKKDYDLLIIGGGSAGLTAARFARKIGLSVSLVEKGQLGGDCTWTGCVPSKTLLKAAKTANTIRDAGRYGITTVESIIDFKSAMAELTPFANRYSRANRQKLCNQKALTSSRAMPSSTTPGLCPWTAVRYLPAGS